MKRQSPTPGRGRIFGHQEYYGRFTSNFFSGSYQPSFRVSSELLGDGVSLTSNRSDSQDLSAVQLYLTFCNSQPLPLFPQRISATSLCDRDLELVLSIEAVGLRFRGNGVKECPIEQEITSKTERACQMVMKRLADGNVELSTIQTLCLLSMLEFTGMSPAIIHRLPHTDTITQSWEPSSSRILYKNGRLLYAGHQTNKLRVPQISRNGARRAKTVLRKRDDAPESPRTFTAIHSRNF